MLRMLSDLKKQVEAALHDNAAAAERLINGLARGRPGLADIPHSNGRGHIESIESNN